MADQTVHEQRKRYGHADALEDLSQTAKAAGIVRAVSLALGYHADMAVQDAEMLKLERWAPSIDAALGCLKKIEASQTEAFDSPLRPDWCTPLSLLEATASVFWWTDVPQQKAMSCGQVEDLCEAVLESLSTLHDDLSAVAKELQGGAA